MTGERIKIEYVALQGALLRAVSRRTDTSGGSWSTLCNTFTTGHVVICVFIRLKARTFSGDAEYQAPLFGREMIYTLGSVPALGQARQW